MAREGEREGEGEGEREGKGRRGRGRGRRRGRGKGGEGGVEGKEERGLYSTCSVEHKMKRTVEHLSHQILVVMLYSVMSPIAELYQFTQQQIGGEYTPQLLHILLLIQLVYRGSTFQKESSVCVHHVAAETTAEG